jgi:phospholipid N-methyltransferase
VGALGPSSPALVTAVLEHARIGQAKTVVEFGPGTGAFTAEILQRLSPGARLIAFEIDPHFVANLKARFTDPRAMIIGASADESPKYLAGLGIQSIDCIVSSLPLTLLPRDLRHRILQATTECLRPGGVFVTYQFTTALAKPVLQSYFPQSRRTSVVLRSFPPAMVFACHKETSPATPWPAQACLVPDEA